MFHYELGWALMSQCISNISCILALSDPSQSKDNIVSMMTSQYHLAN